MKKLEIIGKIISFLKEFPSVEEELTETTHLLEEWFIDSLQIVETVMFLEETFGINLSRADINPETFENVAVLSEIVWSRMSKTKKS